MASRQLATKLRGLGVPVVNVSGSRREGVDFPRVTSDAEAVVRMAVAHLHEKGLRHVAFCGEPQRPFIDFWTEAYQNVHMIPVFKKHHGNTPARYRANARLGV